MREYGRVVYQCTYVRAMVELSGLAQQIIAKLHTKITDLSKGFTRSVYGLVHTCLSHVNPVAIG